jgi:hypothetical protein
MKMLFDILQSFKYKFGLDRKNFILRYIKSNRCTRILEIGVFNGNFAERLIKVASNSSPNSRVYYLGIDLFAEGMTQEKYLEEVSLQPRTRLDVQKHLSKFGNAQVDLIQGDSTIVVPLISKNLKFDVIHIDGGHSFTTVQKDWLNISNLMDSHTAVFFDDYTNDRGVTKGGFGIKAVVDGINTAKYEIVLSKNPDFFWKRFGLLSLRMAKVSIRNKEN